MMSMTMRSKGSIFRMHVRFNSHLAGHTNFFAGSPLNRLAWLRTSPSFLNATVLSPTTRWVLFNDGKPLVASRAGGASSNQGSLSLARLSTEEIRPLLGEEPFFSQGRTEGEVAKEDEKELVAARFRGPPVVFLGLHEHPSSSTSRALPSSEFSAKATSAELIAKLYGTPYFALDVSEIEPGKVEGVLRANSSGGKLEWVEGRAAMGFMSQWESGVFAGARSIVDWRSRNKYCAGCGSPVYSMWAGWKHACSSLLPWANKHSEKPCPTSKALHNYLHPRTDPVVIIATVNTTNDRILLGRNKNWPKNFYSALAGFVEPGESLEDTVRREMWEEAGVKVEELKYHSTQPWPFPANVMAGFYAVAKDETEIRTDLDNELEDARWYTRDEILSVLHQEKTGSQASQAPKWDSAVEEQAEAANQERVERKDEPIVKIPPRNAMAGVLISDWARGRVVF